MLRFKIIHAVFVFGILFGVPIAIGIIIALIYGFSNCDCDDCDDIEDSGGCVAKCLKNMGD